MGHIPWGWGMYLMGFGSRNILGRGALRAIGPKGGGHVTKSYTSRSRRKRITDDTRWKSEIAKVDAKSDSELFTAVKALASQANILIGKWVIVQKVRGEVEGAEFLAIHWIPR